MRTRHIIIAWIGTLVVGSLLIYPSDQLIEASTGIESSAHMTDYWRMTTSHLVVAFFLSLPNLFLLFALRPWFRDKLRYERQFDVALILTLIGVWIGTIVLDNNLDAALAYSAGGILSIVALRFEPIKRRTTLVF